MKLFNKDFNNGSSNHAYSELVLLIQEFRSNMSYMYELSSKCEKNVC